MRSGDTGQSLARLGSASSKRETDGGSGWQWSLDTAVGELSPQLCPRTFELLRELKMTRQGAISLSWGVWVPAAAHSAR